MSIAEFYIDNGIDPSDPYSMDNFLRAQLYDSSPPTLFSGLAIVQDQVALDSRYSRSEASSWPLNESELDYMGETRGWEKIEGLPSQPPMASYKRDGVRLNFWLSKGTVGSYLNHPRQGKTQLFRRNIAMSEAREVFDNPRRHTDKGYHKRSDISCNSGRKRGTKRKAECPVSRMRVCARCGKSKSNEQYSNNQRRKGALAKCKACV